MDIKLKFNSLIEFVKEKLWINVFKNDYRVGVYNTKISELELQLAKVTLKNSELISNCTDKFTELTSIINEQKYLIKKLEDSDIVYTKPSFLDNTIPYSPKSKIVTIKGEVIINVGATNIYSRTTLIKNIVATNKWKELYIKNKKQCAYDIWKFVIYSISYELDKEEDWRNSTITLSYAKGDCVANYEEIYTKEGVKKIGDLKIGDIILSYDFNTKNYTYKPITKIWEKGILPRKRVHLRNGNHIDITDNHPLWVRTNQKYSEYEKRYLKDIDLTRWWKRKLPSVKHLPYKIKDMEWLTEDLCFVIGHYLAEGYDGYTCGYDCIEHIIPILEKENIPFTETKNNSGVPVIRFKKSKFKEYLKSLKNNSFDINVPEELFHLPATKIQQIVMGHLLGDGHLCRDFTGINNLISNALYCHSTSSEKLAKDLVRMYLQLGTPIYCWKQVKHQGVGTKPIWRLTLNPESHFNKDYGYKGLSEVSISFIEDLRETEMRDFTVQDTHTFIFKNGLVSHQCEDTTILFIDLAKEAGFTPLEVFNVCGKVTANNKSFGHSFPILNYGKGWYIYESTLTKLPDEPMKFKGSYYSGIWGCSNWLFQGMLTNKKTQI